MEREDIWCHQSKTTITVYNLECSIFRTADDAIDPFNCAISKGCLHGNTNHDDIHNCFHSNNSVTCCHDNQDHHCDIGCHVNLYTWMVLLHP